MKRASPVKAKVAGRQRRAPRPEYDRSTDHLALDPPDRKRSSFIIDAEVETLTYGLVEARDRHIANHKACGGPSRCGGRKAFDETIFELAKLKLAAGYAELLISTTVSR